MYLDVLSTVELESLSRKSGARSGVHPEQIVPQYSSRWDETTLMVELAHPLTRGLEIKWNSKSNGALHGS